MCLHSIQCSVHIVHQLELISIHNSLHMNRYFGFVNISRIDFTMWHFHIKTAQMLEQSFVQRYLQQWIDHNTVNGFNAFNGIQIEILLPSTSPHGCNFGHVNDILWLCISFFLLQKKRTHENSIIHMYFYSSRNTFHSDRLSWVFIRLMISLCFFYRFNPKPLLSHMEHLYFLHFSTS